MIKTCLVLFLAVVWVAQTNAAPLPAHPFHHKKCESVVDYKPPKGVFRLYRLRVGSEWEQRSYPQKGGPDIHYRVKVVTYRERFSDGSRRTWKCVVSGTEEEVALYPRRPRR